MQEALRELDISLGGEVQDFEDVCRALSEINLHAENSAAPNTALTQSEGWSIVGRVFKLGYCADERVAAQVFSLWGRELDLRTGKGRSEDGSYLEFVRAALRNIHVFHSQELEGEYLSIINTSLIGVQASDCLSALPHLSDSLTHHSDNQSLRRLALKILFNHIIQPHDGHGDPSMYLAPSSSVVDRLTTLPEGVAESLRSARIPRALCTVLGAALLSGDGFSFLHSIKALAACGALEMEHMSKGDYRDSLLESLSHFCQVYTGNGLFCSSEVLRAVCISVLRPNTTLSLLDNALALTRATDDQSGEKRGQGIHCLRILSEISVHNSVQDLLMKENTAERLIPTLESLLVTDGEDEALITPPQSRPSTAGSTSRISRVSVPLTKVTTELASMLKIAINMSSQIEEIFYPEDLCEVCFRVLEERKAGLDVHTITIHALACFNKSHQNRSTFLQMSGPARFMQWVKQNIFTLGSPGSEYCVCGCGDLLFAFGAGRDDEVRRVINDRKGVEILSSALLKIWQNVPYERLCGLLRFFAGIMQVSPESVRQFKNGGGTDALNAMIRQVPEEREVVHSYCVQLISLYPVPRHPSTVRCLQCLGAPNCEESPVQTGRASPPPSPSQREHDYRMLSQAPSRLPPIYNPHGKPDIEKSQNRDANNISNWIKSAGGILYNVNNRIDTVASSLKQRTAKMRPSEGSEIVAELESAWEMPDFISTYESVFRVARSHSKRLPTDPSNVDLPSEPCAVCVEDAILEVAWKWNEVKSILKASEESESVYKVLREKQAVGIMTLIDIIPNSMPYQLDTRPTGVLLNVSNVPLTVEETHTNRCDDLSSQGFPHLAQLFRLTLDESCLGRSGILPTGDNPATIDVKSKIEQMILSMNNSMVLVQKRFPVTRQDGGALPSFESRSPSPAESRSSRALHHQHSQFNQEFSDTVVTIPVTPSDFIEVSHSMDFQLEGRRPRPLASISISIEEEERKALAGKRVASCIPSTPEALGDEGELLHVQPHHVADHQLLSPEVDDGAKYLCSDTEDERKGDARRVSDHEASAYETSFSEAEDREAIMVNVMKPNRAQTPPVQSRSATPLPFQTTVIPSTPMASRSELCLQYRDYVKECFMECVELDAAGMSACMGIARDCPLPMTPIHTSPHQTPPPTAPFRVQPRQPLVPPEGVRSMRILLDKLHSAYRRLQLLVHTEIRAMAVQHGGVDSFDPPKYRVQKGKYILHHIGGPEAMRHNAAVSAQEEGVEYTNCDEIIRTIAFTNPLVNGVVGCATGLYRDPGLCSSRLEELSAMANDLDYLMPDQEYEKKFLERREEKVFSFPNRSFPYLEFAASVVESSSKRVNYVNWLLDEANRLTGVRMSDEDVAQKLAAYREERNSVLSTVAERLRVHLTSLHFEDCLRASVVRASRTKHWDLKRICEGVLQCCSHAPTLLGADVSIVTSILSVLKVAADDLNTILDSYCILYNFVVTSGLRSFMETEVVPDDGLKGRVSSDECTDIYSLLMDKGIVHLLVGLFKRYKHILPVVCAAVKLLKVLLCPHGISISAEEWQRGGEVEQCEIPLLAGRCSNGVSSRTTSAVSKFVAGEGLAALLSVLGQPTHIVPTALRTEIFIIIVHCVNTDPKAIPLLAQLNGIVPLGDSLSFTPEWVQKEVLYRLTELVGAKEPHKRLLSDKRFIRGVVGCLKGEGSSFVKARCCRLAFEIIQLPDPFGANARSEFVKLGVVTTALQLLTSNPSNADLGIHTTSLLKLLLSTSAKATTILIRNDGVPTLLRLMGNLNTSLSLQLHVIPCIMSATKTRKAVLQFVRCRGPKVFATVVKSFSMDPKLSPLLCQFFASISTWTSATAAQLNASALAEVTQNGRVKQNNGTRNSMAAYITHELMREDIFPFVVKCLQRLKENMKCQVHCMEFIANASQLLGYPAQEVFVHQLSVLPLLVRAIQDFSSNAAVLSQAVKTLLALVEGNHKTAKGVCCTQGCLKSLAAVLLNVFHPLLEKDDAPPPLTSRSRKRRNTLTEAQSMGPTALRSLMESFVLDASPQSEKPKVVRKSSVPQRKDVSPPLSPWGSKPVMSSDEEKSEDEKSPALPTGIPQTTTSDFEDSGYDQCDDSDSSSESPAEAHPTVVAPSRPDSRKEKTVMMSSINIEQVNNLPEWNYEEDREESLEIFKPLAAGACRLFARLSLSRGTSALLGQHCVTCVLTIMRCYPEERDFLSDGCRLLSVVASLEETKERLYVTKGTQLLLSLLELLFERPNVLLRVCSVLASACQNYVPNSDALTGSGAIGTLSRVLKAYPQFPRLSMSVFRILGHMTQGDQDAREHCLREGVPHALLAALGLSKDQPNVAAWGAYVLGNLCFSRASREAVQEQHTLATIVARVRLSLGLVRPNRPPPKPSPFLQQMVGYALSAMSFYIEDGEMNDAAKAVLAELDHEIVIQSVMSAQASPHLTDYQRETCMRALELLEKECKLINKEIFLIPPPKLREKEVQDPRDAKIESLQRELHRLKATRRLKKLSEEVKRINDEDAVRVEEMRLEIKAEGKEAARRPRRRSADDVEREHTSTPRVYWKCQTPPPSKLLEYVPPNPEKILVESLTSTSAVLKWRSPKLPDGVAYKLEYRIQLSQDKGRTFATLEMGTSSRMYTLSGLHPSTLYYASVSSWPVPIQGTFHEGSLPVPPGSLLRKRQQKLLHFTTPAAAFTQDRFITLTPALLEHARNISASAAKKSLPPIVKSH